MIGGSGAGSRPEQHAAGITLAGTPEQRAVLQRAVLHKVHELVELATAHGYRRDELVAMIRSAP